MLGCSNITQSIFLLTNKSNGGKRRIWDFDCRRKKFEIFFEHFAKEQNKFSEMFFERHTPIFVTESEGHRADSRRTIVSHARLLDYEFFRVFDVYQAHQEIAMYLGNMAEPRKPIPHISDEIMAQAKGFDKFSFRKDKRR